MLRRAAIVVVVTAALAAAAGDPVAAIIDEARGNPIEVFADVVFHLLDTGKIPDKERVPLLDEVFLRATDAREAVPERPAPIGPRRAVPIRGQIKLDALSIECRVVRALLGIDAKHGRELFGRIPRPHVAKTDCKGAILEEPTLYFETVEAVVLHAPFTAKEQEDRVPFWTIESAVRGIQTSLEITPAGAIFPTWYTTRRTRWLWRAPSPLRLASTIATAISAGPFSPACWAPYRRWQTAS